MSNPRKPISKKLRFEVFKRDSFTCQYCGVNAPRTVLRVDHIKPVAKGGVSHISNYVTACFDCNAGKGARELTDSQEIEKQKKQLEILNERREQLELIKQWRDECLSVECGEVGLAIERMNQEYGPDDDDKKTVKMFRRLIQKFGIGDVLDGIDIACNNYDDREMAISKLKGILSLSEAEKTVPGSSKIPYVIAILRNRGLYRPVDVSRLIANWLQCGIPIETIIGLAKRKPNWTAFEDALKQEVDK